MDESLIEETVSADVIPMNVGGENHDRQIDKCSHDGANIGNASPGIHERRTLAPHEDVAVDVLPVAVVR
jgi:hypothetical protein